MELKTLNDIGVCGCCEVEDQQEYGCMKPELREEAIKYIKDMEGFIERNKGKPSIGEHDEDAMLLGAISWIKHFFNIAENDALKQEGVKE